MKKTLAITVALLSANSFAADNTISKSAVPTRIVVAKEGVGLGQFSMMSFDFPSSHRFAPKKLKSVSWRTTYYPDNMNERVQICYTKPAGSGYDDCREISPNSSGDTDDFNKYSFDKYARFTFRHMVKGGKNQGAPAGEDSIVVHYSY
ncbi:hypothetical protein AFK24_14555 [Pseudomonas syringae]|uniref:Uncharacterized protein n=1 Tax=Pseudomonas syringae TaxID=317 RepID=A0A1C7Z761_PSESX|nr:hypothetical protein [Pseudomonas syringae]OCR24308.1 hypothetical protein AFK24_14555 [Pseudomonas syringae]